MLIITTFYCLSCEMELKRIPLPGPAVGSVRSRTWNLGGTGEYNDGLVPTLGGEMVQGLVGEGCCGAVGLDKV